MKNMLDMEHSKVLYKKGELLKNARNLGLNNNFDSLTEDKVLSMLPKLPSIEHMTYFYGMTGLQLCWVFRCQYRDLYFTMFGCFPGPNEKLKDCSMMEKSGYFYAGNDESTRFSEDDYDIVIEQDVEYIAQTRDNYIIVPKDEELPFGMPGTDPNFERFYFPKQSRNLYKEVI